jgi:uncharacterized protein
MTSAEGAKLDLLRRVVRGYGSALVAFSGGADSALVLKVAHDELGPRARALTAVSPTMARREKDRAVAFAAAVGMTLDVVESHELERPGFAMNPTDRCYHCKAELLDLARPHADRLELATVLLGTNVDDLGDHRPGLLAANERGARHPLVEAGLTKAEVRAVSRALGLSTWDKPQLACLSSRFPYGTQISAELLARVEAAEDVLWERGFRQFRVRHFGDTAKIETAPEEMPAVVAQAAELVAAFRAIGYKSVTLDLAGYRRGSLNDGVVAIGADQIGVRGKVSAGRENARAEIR